MTIAAAERAARAAEERLAYAKERGTREDRKRAEVVLWQARQAALKVEVAR